MLPDPAIPGQTPLDDLSGLRITTIRTTAQLNAAEAQNIRKAAMKYLVSKPSKRSARFDTLWLKKLQAEMLGDVWTWAGTLRKRETNIGAQPHLIETDLLNLIEDLKAWQLSTMPRLEQAVRLHHIAVRIHPFPNGNGRWSRKLGNIWLKLHGAQPVDWPETTIGTASTIPDQYLTAIRVADRGDLTRLRELHRTFVRRT